jgi:hypothetical protein
MGSGKPKIIHFQENKVDVQVEIHRFIRRNGIIFDYIPPSWLEEPRISTVADDRGTVHKQ